jgi:hypothetical protein
MLAAGDKLATVVDQGRNGRERERMVKAEKSLRMGTVNVGTMNRRYGEVAEMLRRRRVDFCCLQETRWKGEHSRTDGGYIFFWK